MPTVVSETSVVRAPAHSPASSGRSQSGADEAASPFSELLDSCEPVDSGAAPADTAPKSVENRPAEAAPQADKADESEDPSKAAVNDKDVTKAAQAELMLAIAVVTQQAVSEGEPEGEEEAQPATSGATEEAAPDEAQSDADPSLLPLPQAEATSDAGTADAPAVVQSAPPPPVAPVPAALPTTGEAAAAVAAVEAAPAATEVTVIPTVEAAAAKTAAPVARPTETVVSASEEKAPKTEKPAVATAEAATDGEAKTPAAPATGAETPEQKAASRSTDAPTHSAPRDAEAPDAKPKAAAPQPLPEAANSAALPAPTATHSAPQVAAPSAHQPALKDTTVPVAGLAVEIAAHAQAGTNRFEIRLDPPELGRIDVRLDVDSDGQVTSHLRVERAETLDLLRRDAPALERALQQAGLKTSDSGLQFSLRDQSFSQHNQGRDAPVMASIVVPDEALAPIETQRHYGRLAGLGSGVDIRV